MHWPGKVTAKTHLVIRIDYITGWAGQGLFVIPTFIDSMLA
jgi:hypothetical protein